MNAELKKLLDSGADSNAIIKCVDDIRKSKIDGIHELDFESFDKEVRAILLLWYMGMELCGSGVELYLRGFCGSFHYQILDLLKIIGAERTHSILNNLKSLFKNQLVPKEPSERDEAINAFYETDESLEKWSQIRADIDSDLQDSAEADSGKLIQYLRNGGSLDTWWNEIPEVPK